LSAVTSPFALRLPAGLLLVSAALSGCVPIRMVVSDLEDVERLLEKTRAYNGDRCAPEEFANAVSDATFARVAFRTGDAVAASAHTEAAARYADLAWKRAETCGGTDFDGDGIADVMDRCPKEPEDVDGINDDDGCPDVDPYGDEDADGVRNIDDGCPEEAEDFDGHNDEDGCPETSEDTDGDGIIDANDRCPEEAEDLDGFKDADGCADPDNDADRIIDIRDACPNAAEDLDNWEDLDGCPDIDNDRDGIEDTEDSCPDAYGTKDTRGCPSSDRDMDGVSDSADKCPESAETRNGFLDDDGCPDTVASALRLTRDRIELPAPLVFAGTSADLESSSISTLDQVAALLTENPNVKLRVEAHTDGTGDESANQILSQRRADTIRTYLLAKGIAAARVTAQGFGATRPVDTNRTEAGRANNRRVELVVIQ
jgi:OOP family OmpA-OmpF porin